MGILQILVGYNCHSIDDNMRRGEWRRYGCGCRNDIVHHLRMD